MPMQDDKAYWIETDGTVSEVTPNNGTDFQLDELQGFVRGKGEGGESDTITIVYLPRERVMVANDDGRIIGLEHNSKATEEYHLAGGALHNPIVGNVLICPKAMVR